MPPGGFLPAESCQYIYNEHFLEHLPVPTAIAFLTECHRLLRPGGVLRVAMPHVAASVHRYLREDWKNDPAIEKYGLTWIQTRAEMINVSFRYWGHQWLYDEEELERRLREAGFGKLSIVSWGESAHAELQNRETREESRLVCEATKE